MNSAEDMALMLNLGWSLTEIAAHFDLSVAIVKLMICAHLKTERLIARLQPASERS